MEIVDLGFLPIWSAVYVAESELPSGELTPEQEARHIIRKIRHHVRLLNRKWAEVHQKSIEWQARIEDTLVVSNSIASFLSPK